MKENVNYAVTLQNWLNKYIFMDEESLFFNPINEEIILHNPVIHKERGKEFHIVNIMKMAKNEMIYLTSEEKESFFIGELSNEENFNILNEIALHNFTNPNEEEED